MHVNKITYRSLTGSLVRTLNEQDALKLLKLEQSGGKRKTVMLRLHDRYAKLRNKREKESLLRILQGNQP